MDEEDESYEESSCDEDEEEDGVAESEGSEGESVNPYKDGTLIDFGADVYRFRGWEECYC